MEIEKEEFLKMTQKMQNATIYNSVINLEEKIDKFKIRLYVYASVGGVFGGYLAMLSKWLLE